jgi:hypothetical protein
MMPPAIYAIGTEAALGEFSVTLNHVDAQNGMVIDIAYTVKNISPAPAPLSHFPALHLENGKGGVIDAVAAGIDVSRMLAPGEYLSARARFRIPKGTADPLAWLLRLGGDESPRITLR